MLNWYLQGGKNSDVVISTRIRIARNLEDIPFVNKGNIKQLEQVLEKIENITPNIGYGLKFIRLKDLDDITKVSLVEKHVISPEFAMNKTKTEGIVINDEENICMMINDEDHIKLQVFSSGQDLENLMNLIIEIDNQLNKIKLDKEV